uniref:TRPM SLOG domain-containing protein n=1 Tax=Poecilia mexicana TaxID=48701 RepID=A0A3B3XCU5_9TELE
MYICFLEHEHVKLCNLCFHSKKEVCYCGNLKTDHTDEVIKTGDSIGIHKAPTDAFGEIHWKCDYVRVSADTEATVLYKLLTEQWELSPPKLVISVTGGAKNFYLKSHLKKVFYRGLMKIAQTTGAWLITGGTNVGVMRHVGQAVRDYTLSNTKQKEVVAIGVAPWGVIHNKDKLVNEVKDICLLCF